MSFKDLDYQRDVITKHLAKAEQCYEYGKLEDGSVHLKIAEILQRGLMQINTSSITL